VHVCSNVAAMLAAESGHTLMPQLPTMPVKSQGIAACYCAARNLLASNPPSSEPCMHLIRRSSCILAQHQLSTSSAQHCVQSKAFKKQLMAAANT
jgi:hypothetical protein